MASMSDVAKRAGVSISTVSKVLNNYANLSEETREKVLQAVEELNYVPNAVASALSSKTKKRVAVVVFINNERQAIDEINMQYLFGTAQQAKEEKLELITVFSNLINDFNKIELIQYFKSMSIAGMIVYGLNKEEEIFIQMLEEEHFKTVLVDYPVLNENTSYVMVDHLEAQKELAKQVITEHKDSIKNVLYLAGRRDGFVTDLRLQGVFDACDELGVNLNAQYADFSERQAKELTLKYGKNADVVICASDLMAIGATEALKQMNLNIPVSGYDGIKLLGYVRYDISTVKQDFYKIAIKAVEEMKELLQGGSGRESVMDYEITKINYEDVII